MIIPDLLKKKQRGERIAMLTAYDHPTARLLDEAGIDILLVGDSVANVVLGLKSTTEVGMDVMLHHAAAVVRGTKKALVVADMPFEAYQLPGADPVAQARRFLAIGCHAVKVEWCDRCVDTVRALVTAGIPVMGHIGLTPQTAEQLGGFKVQGKDPAAAARILEQARQLELLGCFSVVLECVPDLLAKEITAALKIPAIGIGAGPFCDGQVLVVNDVLGLYGTPPRFVKQYVDLGALIRQAALEYKEDVQQGRFPAAG